MESFLHKMEDKGIRVAHVQLLGAGRSRVFHPWICLVQMARAYGDWFASKKRGDNPLRLNVYVVDPAVIALLHGGYVNIAEHLERSPLRIAVEIIDTKGRIDRYHKIVQPNATLRDITGRLRKGKPRVYAFPAPSSRFDQRSFDHSEDTGVREFGLVTGSTLIIDYR
jgi:hypothetical protein